MNILRAITTFNEFRPFDMSGYFFIREIKKGIFKDKIDNIFATRIKFKLFSRF